jgi:hypothetical protein
MIHRITVSSTPKFIFNNNCHYNILIIPREEGVLLWTTQNGDIERQ